MPLSDIGGRCVSFLLVTVSVFLFFHAVIIPDSKNVVAKIWPIRYIIWNDGTWVVHYRLLDVSHKQAITWPQVSQERTKLTGPNLSHRIYCGGLDLAQV